MLKTNFSGHDKIWREAQKNLWGTAPECPLWLRAWFEAYSRGASRATVVKSRPDKLHLVGDGM